MTWKHMSRPIMYAGKKKMNDVNEVRMYVVGINLQN